MFTSSMVKLGSGTEALSIASKPVATCASKAEMAIEKTTSIEIPTMRPPIPTEAPISEFTSKRLNLTP